MANHSRGREEQRLDIIKVVSMMMLMVITTLYANRNGSAENHIGRILSGMEDVMHGFLPGDSLAARQVRGNLSEALDEIVKGKNESVPTILRV